MSFRIPLGLSRTSRMIPSPPFLPRGFFMPTRQISTQCIAGPSRLSIRQPPILNLVKREFATSSSKLVRSTYFPKGSGSGGGWSGGPRNGWFDRLRARLNGYSEQRIIYTLIGLNVGVYALWQYAQTSWTRFKDPSLYHFMSKNFVLSEPNIMAGRIWTILTSSFSHSRGDHILLNCLGLYFIAPGALSVLGGAGFLGLYLAGGVAASLTSLAWHRLTRNRVPGYVGSEGASGAIYSTLGFYAALFPNSTVLMFFVIPMPMWAAVGGIFAWDLYSAVSRPFSGTDSAGHVGGLALGLLAAYRLKKGRGFRRW